MPIRPDMIDRYPADWAAISSRIRFGRAESRCECTGWCGAQPHGEGRCEARQNAPHPLTGSTVFLTVAHLDHVPEHSEPDNLRALCQKCHLAYDAEQHRIQASHTRALKTTEGMDPLFELDTMET